MLASMRGHDPAVNLLPSTHCSMAVYAVYGLRGQRGLLWPWSVVTMIGIALSTLLTRQHYLVDVVSGLILGAVVGRHVHRRHLHHSPVCDSR